MQMIKCRCGADQWDTVKFCSECGKPIASPSAEPTPVVAQQPTIRVVKAGQQCRLAGAGAVALGVLLAVAASPGAGLPIALIGLVLFVVGQALE